MEWERLWSRAKKVGILDIPLRREKLVGIRTKQRHVLGNGCRYS